MPEWLIEHGFGETRAALVDDGEIVEARIELAGVWRAGEVIKARLIDLGTNGRNALARDDQGEYLLPRGAAGIPEGGSLYIQIMREVIPGAEPWKRPLAAVANYQKRVAVPRLADRLGVEELAFPRETDALAASGWSDLLDDARTGILRFSGGELRIEPTAAMTLIDVDGYLDREELAVRGAAEAARAIRRLDIGGSIGIDLPTAGSKAVRQAAAEAIDTILPPPFERTAVNGFGFVQVVRPRTRPSLVELARDRAAFEARALLRRTAFEAPGPKRLVAHPNVTAVIGSHPAWLDNLARAVGGSVGLRADPALPMSGGYVESI